MKLKFVYTLQGDVKFITVGLVFGVVAVLANRLPHWIYEPFESQKNWHITTAQIVEINYDVELRKYEHWVKYETDLNEEIISKSNRATSSLPQMGYKYHIMYNPTLPSEFFSNDLKQNADVFKVTGFLSLVFGSIAVFLFIMMFLKIYYKTYKPQMLPLLDFWIEIGGGSMGALSFAIPALGVDLVYWYISGESFGFFTSNVVVWVFRLLGLATLLGVFFMVRYFLKHKPKIS